VFVTPKANGTLKFVKQLKALIAKQKAEGAERAFEVPVFFRPEEAVNHLLQACQTEGIQIDRKAALVLVESHGHALLPLMMIVKRLWVYMGCQLITEAVVREQVVLEESIFELIKGWVGRQSANEHGEHAKGFWVQVTQLTINQEPLRLIALMHQQLSYFYKLRLWHGLGMTIDTMAQRLNKKTYPVQKELAWLAKVPLERLTHLRQALLAGEIALKTEGLPAQMLLERLLAC
jgi:DNA polymerase III delta subunit